MQCDGMKISQPEKSVAHMWWNWITLLKTLSSPELSVCQLTTLEKTGRCFELVEMTATLANVKKGFAAAFPSSYCPTDRVQLVSALQDAIHEV